MNADADQFSRLPLLYPAIVRRPTDLSTQAVDTGRHGAYNAHMETIWIQTTDDIAPHLDRLMAAKVIGVDLETTGLDPHTARVRLAQLAIEDGPVFVIDCFTFLPAGEAILRDALSTAAVKVFQNAKFDLQFLLPLDIFPTTLFDTMLAGRLLYMPGMPWRVNLETLAQHYLGEALDKQAQKSDWGGDLSPAQRAYAAKDAEILPRLRRVMLPMIVSAGLSTIAAIEFQCVRAIAQMEYRGIYLDTARWQTLLDEKIAEREMALEALYAYTGRPMAQTTLWGEDEVIGLNLDSNAYVLRLLHDNGIHVESTAKGDLYPHRNHPLVKALSAYRKAAKAVSAILLPVLAEVHLVTGRLHPRYGQIGAHSGRMSCGGPNIQQIPRGQAFRACFRAPAGRKLVIADYSQIELRVAAQISGDARMLDAYQQGEDLHRLTASLISGMPMDAVGKQQRQAAKAVNFGLIYGMGAAGLQQYAQQAYGVEMNLTDATTFRQRFFEAYEGLERWHQRLKDNPPREGRTLTGRRFAFSEKPSLPELSNSPVQGTAADIIKKALGLLATRLMDTSAWMVAVIHDEILLECDAAEAEAIAALLKTAMEEAGNDILPLVPVIAEAKISDSWAEK